MSAKKEGGGDGGFGRGISFGSVKRIARCSCEWRSGHEGTKQWSVCLTDIR